MRTALALFVAALLAIAAPVPAGAHSVPAEATTTAVTASASGRTVTLTITVAASSEPVPEGTVTVTEGDTDLGTVALDGGTATWSGTAAYGYHQYVATYTPADERWLTSTSEPIGVGVGDLCHVFICEPVHLIDIRAAKRVIVEKRTPITVRARGRGNIRIKGAVLVEVTGPREFAWARRAPLVRGAATLRSPRFPRTGRFRLVVTVEPSTEPMRDTKRTTSIRVVEPREPRK